MTRKEFEAYLRTQTIDQVVEIAWDWRKAYFAASDANDFLEERETYFKTKLKEKEENIGVTEAKLERAEYWIDELETELSDQDILTDNEATEHRETKELLNELEFYIEISCDSQAKYQMNSCDYSRQDMLLARVHELECEVRFLKTEIRAKENLDKDVSILERNMGESSQELHLLGFSLKDKTLFAVNSRGECYHRPNCGHLKRSHLSEYSWYGSEHEAKEAGYYPCRKCCL